MKTAIAFILGLLLGAGILARKQRQLLQQLESLLAVFPDRSDDRDIALSPIARLRRAIGRNQQSSRQSSDALESYRSLLEGAPIGYLQVDADNHLIACNPQAKAWLGIERWQPDRARLLLGVARSLELDRLVEQTRQMRAIQQLDWVFHRTAVPQGTEPATTQALALRGWGYPLPAAGVGVFLENQQPLADLIRVQDRTFSELAHELRTPLTSICLIAEMVRGRADDTEEREWIERMLGEANRLIALVEDWLDLAQLQKVPSQVLRAELIDLQELTGTVWQTLEPLADRKHLRLESHITDPVCVRADRARLMQVFLNLFDNAIAHSPERGAIQLDARTLPATGDRPACIRVDIIDSGSGFSETDLERVFERLYRGNPARQHPSDSINTTARPGTGLGLTIVRQIVRAHAGNITARNHPETGGAWLQIELPQNTFATPQS